MNYEDYEDYEENSNAQLHPIQKQFIDLIRSSSLLNNIHLQDEYLIQIKNLLENPETEQYIHIQQLKQYELIPLGTVLYCYLAEKFEDHHEKITLSINIDNIVFIKNHFVNWFEDKTKNYYYKDDTENEMLSLFNNAIISNSTNVIKFFLTDKELLSKFSHYIYQKKELNSALRYAVDNNNINLIEFLTQSTSIKDNPTLSIIDIKNNHNDLQKNTIAFIKKELKDIKNISEIFEAYSHKSQIFIHEEDNLLFNNFTEQLKDFLNTDLIKKYEVESIKGIQFLFNYAAKTNNTKLLQYFLSSDTFLNKVNSLCNNQEAYITACQSNSINVIEILIPAMYQQHLKDNKNKPFILNSQGLNATCLYHWNDLTKKILEYKEPQETDFSMAFYSSCSAINIEIIPILIEKSITQISSCKKLNSIILDEYPYYHNMEALLLYNQNNNEEKIIQIIDYLFNEPKLNPNSYNNYQHHLPKRNLELNKLFLQVFTSGKIKLIDYFICSDNPSIKSVLSEYVNDNLIKFIFEVKVSKIDYKLMLNYLINDIGIKRSENLHNYLQDLIDYGSNGTSKEQQHKLWAQYAMDIYDVLEFNEKLEQKVNSITRDNISSISVKKKI